MSTEDVRWKQRFNNYCKALETLTLAVAEANKRELSNLEKQGVIQSFEYVHELAWNVLKDYLEEYGSTGLIGSKDTLRKAFAQGLIEDGEIWMDTIKTRNQTSHTYEGKILETVFEKIVSDFYPCFQKLGKQFTSRYSGEE